MNQHCRFERNGDDSRLRPEFVPPTDRTRWCQHANLPQRAPSVRSWRKAGSVRNRSRRLLRMHRIRTAKPREQQPGRARMHTWPFPPPERDTDPSRHRCAELDTPTPSAPARPRPVRARLDRRGGRSARCVSRMRTGGGDGAGDGSSWTGITDPRNGQDALHGVQQLYASSSRRSTVHRTGARGSPPKGRETNSRSLCSW